MPESAKEGVRGLAEGPDIGLGARCRGGESLYSDQKPLKSTDFRGFFLFFVYCGAGFKNYLTLWVLRKLQQN